MSTTPTAPRLGVGVVITKDQQVLLLRRRNISWMDTATHTQTYEQPN